MVAGLALVGPRRVLWSRGLLGGAALAFVIGSPNLVYQATHDWPQLTMGRALADNNAGEVRVHDVAVPAADAGSAARAGLGRRAGRACRRAEWRPVRFLAAAFPVLLVLVFVMGAQVYYPFGLLAVLFAVGCVPVSDVLARTRAGGRAGRRRRR